VRRWGAVDHDPQAAWAIRDELGGADPAGRVAPGALDRSDRSRRIAHLEHEQGRASVAPQCPRAIERTLQILGRRSRLRDPIGQGISERETAAHQTERRD
jgi:hypothetical protein